MPRGTTLANLLVMLKAEIGDNATGNTVRDAQLKQLLANKQQLLASTYEWPFLERKWDVVVGIGSRYATFPTTTATGSDFATADVPISMEHSITVEVLYGTVWYPVLYGINQEDLTWINSDDTTRQYPLIMRWRWATNAADPSTINQFEVWPIPSVAQQVRFTGQRRLQPLAVDADKADLDDIMLVNFVAADRLTALGQVEEAKLKLSIAQARMTNIRGSYLQREQRLIMGQDNNMLNREQKRAVPMVVVAP